MNNEQHVWIGTILIIGLGIGLFIIRSHNESKWCQTLKQNDIYPGGDPKYSSPIWSSEHFCSSLYENSYDIQSCAKQIRDDAAHCYYQGY